MLRADHPCDLGPLGWPFLAFALGGMAQSPLAAALRESGRCHRVLPDGLDADLHPRMFSICAKGVAPDDVQMVATTLLAVLNQLASTGFSPQFLQAALNAFTFRLTETAPGLRPQGLTVLDRILPGWRYSGDPVAALAQDKALAQLAAGVADRQDLLQSMIRRELLENQHRATCSLHASATLAAPPFAARIAGIAQDLTPAQRRDLAIATANRQHPAVETAGALRSLPFLQRSELPSQISRIRAEAAANVVSITLSDPGIRRVDLARDLTGAAPDLAGYAPLLGRLLAEAASDLPLSARTGGISAICWTGAGFGCPDAARLILRSKALQANGTDLVAVLADTMTRAAVVDPVALLRLVRDEIARQQARLLSAGHQVSELRLRARTGLAGSFADRLDGPGQLAFLHQSAARLASEPELVLGELAQLRAAALTQGNVLIGVRAGLDAGPLLQVLPVRPEMTPRPHHAVAIGTLREGHRIVSPVSAVGLGADLRAAGLKATGATRVGLQALATGWLWDAVRVAGGAYGVRVILDAATGVATFLSFRDPHILRTLQAFGQSGSQLRASTTEALVQRCVIGTLAETTRPHAPDAQALLVLQRHLTGHTDDLRQAEHDAILGATPTDFLDLAAALDHAMPQGPVVVLGPEAALLSALAAEPGLFVIRA